MRLATGEFLEGKIALAPFGLSVTSGDAAPKVVAFANVLEAHLLEPARGKTRPALPAGVLLVNGSYLAGAVAGFGEEQLRVGAVAVPAAHVARAVLKPATRDALHTGPAGRTGVIMPRGDFFVGKLGAVKDGRVLVFSPVLGPRRFALGTEVAQIVLREASAAAPFAVRLANGNVLAATALRVEPDGLTATDSLLGAIKIKTADLAEISAGPGRARLLADAPPARVEPPAGLAAEAAVKVQAMPDAADSRRVLETAANTAVSYGVEPGFSVFMCEIAVPKEMPAAPAVTFAIYADGRPVFRSPPVAPAQPPQAVRVALGPVRILSLRVESAGPVTGAISGQWLHPLLFKP